MQNMVTVNMSEAIPIVIVKTVTEVKGSFEKKRLFAIIEAGSKSLHNRPISFFSGCVHFAIQRPGVESA
jgi:hypothetical protein